MVNSTSGSLKDFASKDGFRLMAFNSFARAIGLREHTKTTITWLLTWLSTIVFRKIYISVYVISVKAIPHPHKVFNNLLKDVQQGRNHEAVYQIDKRNL